MQKFLPKMLLPLALAAVLVCGWILIDRSPASRQLLFHAGVGQRSSLNEIKDLFRARCPEVQVDFAYKGSGYFLADIARSQEGDLYMPGEEFYLLQAVERGFITDYDPQRDIAAETRRVFVAWRTSPRPTSASASAIPRHARSESGTKRPSGKQAFGVASS